MDRINGKSGENALPGQMNEKVERLERENKELRKRLEDIEKRLPAK